jgi:hypothetical protein
MTPHQYPTSEKVLQKLQEIQSRLPEKRPSKAVIEPEKSSETVHNGTRIIDNAEEGVCQIFFKNIPEEKTRRLLKKRKPPVIPVLSAPGI